MKAFETTRSGVITDFNSDGYDVEKLSRFNIQSVFTSVLGSARTFVAGDIVVGTDTVNKTSHGFVTGVKVQLTTDGTLPTGLALLTDYWIIRSDANSLKFAASAADAGTATAVNITDLTGEGTHTITQVAPASAKAFTHTNGVLIGTDLVTSATHGFTVGTRVQLTTSGTVPTGLALATDYYLTAPTANTLGFASSFANALANTLVNITDITGGGTHTVTATTYTARTVLNADVDFVGNDFTFVAHGFVTGTKGQFTTSGTLPTGLALATDYWIIRTDNDVFQVAASAADAGAGTAVVLVDAGSGDHTFTATTFTAKTFIDGDVSLTSNFIYEASHGYIQGMAGQFTTTTTLPAGLSLITDYFIILDGANKYKVATSFANALAGTAVDITDEGTGTHTFTPTAYTAKTFVDGDISVLTNTISDLAHGMVTGLVVQVSTDGVLPAGLSAVTDYYIIRVDADNYKFASSYANALAGTAVDITDLGSGTQTVTGVGLAGTMKLQGTLDGTNYKDIDNKSRSITSSSGNCYFEVVDNTWYKVRLNWTHTSGYADIASVIKEISR